MIPGNTSKGAGERDGGGQQRDKGKGTLSSEVRLGTTGTYPAGGPWGPVQNMHFELSHLPSKREAGCLHPTCPLTQVESCSGALVISQNCWFGAGVDMWHSGHQRKPSGRATWLLTVGKTQRLRAGKRQPPLRSGPKPLHCFNTSSPELRGSGHLARLPLTPQPLFRAAPCHFCSHTSRLLSMPPTSLLAPSAPTCPPPASSSALSASEASGSPDRGTHFVPAQVGSGGCSLSRLGLVGIACFLKELAVPRAASDT